MTDRYQHLMHMRPKALQNYLEERGDPPLVRKQIYDTVVAQQERIANNGRRHSQVVKHWSPLFIPLRNEIKTVRSMIVYNGADPQRREVLDAYMKALMNARSAIVFAKHCGMTPNKYQEWRVENGKKKCPNDLEHWSDLVPAKVRDAITEAFADLPYKVKAKRKVPFTRD